MPVSTARGHTTTVAETKEAGCSSGADASSRAWVLLGGDGAGVVVAHSLHCALADLGYDGYTGGSKGLGVEKAHGGGGWPAEVERHLMADQNL
jgi:hypothetical protein